MMALFDWTEEEKYKHIKHFIDTHPKYSESNAKYLKYWVDFFIIPTKQLKVQQVQQVQQDIEHPMIGMLPNLEEET